MFNRNFPDKPCLKWKTLSTLNDLWFRNSGFPKQRLQIFCITSNLKFWKVYSFEFVRPMLWSEMVSEMCRATIRHVLSSIAQFIVLNPFLMSPITYLHWKGGVYSWQHYAKYSLYVVEHSEAAATVWKLMEGEAKY